MMPELPLWLSIAFLFTAFVYSMVGFSGAYFDFNKVFKNDLL